ncbi:MAG: ABC transporter ATP-binding protein [Anaerolineales bacterium]|nr:ABC transporter ATP-binding protein [Anaerolineales bacterium]
MEQEKIKLQRVSRVYEIGKGSTIIAVEDVSFAVSAEEFVCIVGPSGCGKSTLLYLIACLEKPSAGEILIDGKPVTEPNPKVGMVFQPDSVFPWLTVRENIEFGPALRGILPSQRQRIAEYYVHLVGLEGFENTLPRQLSGGMKKRVDIARAFANNPEILLMDEPFGALDAMTKEKLQMELLQIWENERKTILFVTHDLEEALMLGTRVIVMSRQPNTIQTILDIPFPHPRSMILKTSSQFQEYRKKLWELLHLNV